MSLPGTAPAELAVGAGAAAPPTGLGVVVLETGAVLAAGAGLTSAREAGFVVVVGAGRRTLREFGAALSCASVGACAKARLHTKQLSTPEVMSCLANLII